MTHEELAAAFDAWRQAWNDSTDGSTEEWSAFLAGVQAAEDEHDRERRDPWGLTPPRAFVCSTCGDTHVMALGDRAVPCTRCPTPCQECRSHGRGAYCTLTPCACSCHRIRQAPAAADTGRAK